MLLSSERTALRGLFSCIAEIVGALGGFASKHTAYRRIRRCALQVPGRISHDQPPKFERSPVPASLDNFLTLAL